MTTVTYPTSADFARLNWHQRMTLERRLRLTHRLGAPTRGVHIVPDDLVWRVTNGTSSAVTSDIGRALRIFNDAKKVSA
jgi:hypothetical protein